MHAMGIRDIVMLALGFGCVPLALYDAYYGLLAYCWLSFMKPQSLVWAEGARESRITFAVAAALILRAILSEGPRFRLRAPSVVFILFWFWVAVSALTSEHHVLAQDFLIKFSKIGVAVLLMTGLVRSREQLKYLILVLAVSPGLYAVRLGLFLLRGGTRTHHGGPIGLDNNDTALFIAMGIPMLAFVAGQVQSAWRRRGLYVVAAMGVPAVIAGGSRGGLLAMGTAAVLTLWRKVAWWRAIILIAIGAAFTSALVAEQTLRRYETIKQYQQDASARGRLNAWRVAARMARANPVTGVGPGEGPFTREYDRYKTDPEDVPHVAHSVWFSTLAGMGYPGLGLYLAMIVVTLLSTRKVRRLAREAPGDSMRWTRDYALMIETAIITFAVGGSFLSQVGFEYVYAVYLLSVPLRAIAEEHALDPLGLAERDAAATGCEPATPARVATGVTS